jgi:hypothetical protein
MDSLVNVNLWSEESITTGLEAREEAGKRLERELTVWPTGVTLVCE